MKKRPVGKFLRFLHGLSVFLCNIHKIEKPLDKGIFLCYTPSTEREQMFAVRKRRTPPRLRSIHDGDKMTDRFMRRKETKWTATPNLQRKCWKEAPL
ncbi:MAG: hypothetical protein II325_06505, partial [Clostridia bacterium]|nr:hypothetical protein [Clostridia bacterium]